MDKELELVEHKASILIDALPYIRDFNQKTVVIEYGCAEWLSGVEEQRLMQDIVLLKSVGMRPIVVHATRMGLDKFRENKRISKLLELCGVKAIGICGVDTREITRIIREHGVMNAAICDEIPADLTPIETYAITGVVEAVSCKEPDRYQAEGEERFRVSLLDYGAKRNIVRELQKRGCTVTVLPATTSAEEILAADPDGVMLSNGPGDPAENTYQIEQIRKLLGKVPMFGICLGHQLTALAAGGSTYKLKYGHRGVNQPVRDLNGVRTYITSQNHGYAVDGDTVKLGKVRFVNANDGTCEGIDYPELKAFTVQFHPEACTGPKDTSFLFDQFVELMKGGRV